MRRLALVFVFVAGAMAPASAGATIDPAEWDAAIAAAEAVDSTIDPPLYDAGTPMAVGGGTVPSPPDNQGFFFPKFGFGVTVGPAGVRGEMVVDQGFGQVFRATAVCLAAAAVPGGAAIAKLVGRLEPGSPVPLPTMVFHVTDGGPGADDAWHVDFSPLSPESVPCVASGSPSPIVGSIVVSVP